MGNRMMEMYDGFVESRDRGDFGALPELHALSSGLKSLCTDVASAGIEACRRTCGGHGYSVLSGLPTLFASYVQNVTWEGDNNVMYLQAARYLIKAVDAVAQGGKPPQGSAAYLGRAQTELSAKADVRSPEDWASPVHALAALRYVAARLIILAAEALGDAAGGTISVEGAPWNNTTVDLIRAARAHCCFVIHQTFVETVEAAAGKVSPEILSALRTVVSLHGIVLLEEAASDLLEGGYATGQQAGWLRSQRRSFARAVRPNAVALVDGFGYEDYLLNSAIGRRDGDVYAALLAAAKASPLNATQEGPAWKPVLESLLNPKSRSKL